MLILPTPSPLSSSHPSSPFSGTASSHSSGTPWTSPGRHVESPRGEAAAPPAPSSLPHLHIAAAGSLTGSEPEQDESGMMEVEGQGIQASHRDNELASCHHNQDQQPKGCSADCYGLDKRQGQRTPR